MFLFKIKLLPTLITLFLLPLFIALGFWQLHRAEEKQILLNRYTTSLNQPPLPITAVKDTTPEYIQVAATGHFDNAHSILLDNKWHQRQIGYQVLTPFVTQGKAVLVNRGWIPRSTQYQQLPQIPEAQAQRIVGWLYVPKKQFSLGQAFAPSNNWPVVAQTLDLNATASRLSCPLYPFIILLSSNAPDEFVHDWHPVISSPHKNQGYAIQWFSFAAVLLVIFLIGSIRRKK